MLINNPRQFWKIINPHDKHTVLLKNNDGVVYEDCVAILNEYFVSAFSDLTCVNYPLVLTISHHCSPLFFYPSNISLNFIHYENYWGTQVSLPSGTNNISAKFLKNTKNVLINLVTTASAIFKSGCPSKGLEGGKGCSNSQSHWPFQPPTSVTCKLMEHVIPSQLSHFLASNSFFFQRSST